MYAQEQEKQNVNTQNGKKETYYVYGYVYNVEYNPKKKPRGQNL